MRQWGSRYAIRAGRNLPDKEFRYLRTVIVTAAVYRGFGSPLRPEELTGSLNLPAPGRRQTLYVVLSTSQSPVFLVNSRYPLLSATPASSRSKSLHQPGHTFSRSYGVNLPSSLTRVLSSALACSAHLPVLVCGTVTRCIPYEAFLGSMGSPTLRAEWLSTSPLGVEWRRGFAYATRLQT